MKFTKPAPNASFTISAAPEWPSIVFETDATGAHAWTWTLVWGAFRKTGTASTPNNRWDAKAAVTDLGGTLTVRAVAGTATATITVTIKGTNPSAAEVTAYLATKADSAGFEKIIAHEAKFKHFRATGEPIRSFDNGYGMCQLTTPTPTFAQVWNWKRNVDGGLALFAEKRRTAITYLSQSNRTYTGDQLRYETVCRWNGGKYHVWDQARGGWVRPSHILCDSQTGNIGWDMTLEANRGKTEAELRRRDSGSYSRPPGSGAGWGYKGVCYADRVLG
jgi:hypothetical protein